MKLAAAFMAGAMTLVLGYYAADAFNAYVDARARAVIMQFFHDLPVQDSVNPPTRQNS